MAGLDIDQENDLKYLIKGVVTSTILSKLYFSAPAHGSDKFAYLPSQYLAEMFKACGVDGIEYESVLRPGGTNLAVFNPDVARVIGVKQYNIGAVTYESTPV